MGDSGETWLHEQIPGIFRVRIPIPAPLRYVNCYLLRGDDGWSVVDTGFHDETTEAAWCEAFRALGLKPGQVSRIIVTHYHPDHYGAAGWLQRHSGAPVLVHSRELATMRVVWQDTFPRKLAGFHLRQGTPPDLVEAMREAPLAIRRLVRPHPRLTTFPGGSELPAGNRRFRALWTPGHTRGLIVLWSAGEGLLLANDMILAPITPNVSAGPAAAQDPLADFLTSLRRVGALAARVALTGHREPIADVAARCRELAAHHRQRLDAAARAIPAGDAGSTAWQVAERLFPDLTSSLANVAFALGETVAHLEHLVRCGRLLRCAAPCGAVRYRRARRRLAAAGPGGVRR